MPRVGLTGGIGSGKSAAAALLAGHGAVIVDADLLARQAVEPGSQGLAEIVDQFGAAVLTDSGELDRAALAEIVDQFGASVLTDSGELDRAALGEIVFADPDARARLNAIVHPRVRELAAQAEQAAGPEAVVVHVIPLLVETGQQEAFDLVVVVDVDPDRQVRRVGRRDGLSAAQVEARMAAQASREQRLAAADVVLDNNGSPEELAAQVAELWERLRRD